MTDISKCNNQNCKIRNTCYRYRAADSDYQSYILIDKNVDSDKDCEHYWKVTSISEVERLNKRWAD